MEKIRNQDGKQCCSARTVLWYLVFIGFAINYMLRINLNMAIVAMVKTRNNAHALSSECLNSTSILSNLTLANTSHVILSKQLSENDRTFSWNAKEQSIVLGAFFWLHWVTQIPGGILATKYGTKLVFGLANFLGVCLGVFIPTAAYWGYQYLVALRIIQGIVAGFAWPSMHNMVARWVPPNERSKFVSAYLGSSVGVAVTYPACGFIIGQWGWEWVFYVSFIAGLAWFTGWWLLVYDSPSKHPRIHPDERQLIEDALGQTYSKDKAPTPWKHIWSSVPVWMNMLCQWGGTFGLFMLMTYGPTYFKLIHGFSVQATGLLTGIGHILRTMYAFVSASIADYLLRNNKMSRTNVRKLAAFGCTTVPGMFLLALAYSGCNFTLAVFFLSAAVTFNGSVSTGPLACIVDLSPNYASIILGMVNSMAAFSGMASPAIIGQLLYQNQTVGQWKKVFWLGSGMMTGTGILYITFAKAELQAWNAPDKMINRNESELVVFVNEKDNESPEKTVD